MGAELVNSVVGGDRPRVLAVVPGGGDSQSSFVFAHRQIGAAIACGADVRIFWVESRTSVTALVRTLRALRREVRAFRPDVVHAHYGTITGLLATFTAAPAIVTFRGSDLNRDPAIGWAKWCLGHLASQWAATRARVIACTSKSLARRLWRPSAPPQIILSGVDLDLFRPMPRDDARRYLGWNIADRVVLFNAGRAPQLKGLELFQAAVGMAQRAIPNLKPFILDGGFPPSEMPLYLNASDCLALASVSEGSPNVVKEALACNLPVVAVDVGDVRERLEGVKCCRIVPRDPLGFANAIADVIVLDTRSNGRDHLNGCSQAAITQMWMTVYRSFVPNSEGVVNTAGVGSLSGQ